MLNKRWKNDSFILFIVLVFCGGQAFFSYKTIETVPFFNYGMYSSVFYKPDFQEVVKIDINGKPFDLQTLPNLAHDFVIKNCLFYHHLRQANFKDPVESTVERRFQSYINTEWLIFLKNRLCNSYHAQQDFAEWVKRYLSQWHTTPIEQLDVFIQQFTYNTHTHHFDLQRTELIASTPFYQ